MGLAGVLGDLLKETSRATSVTVLSHSRAMWWMLLGEPDAVLRELQTAVASHAPPFNLIYLGVDPLFDPLRLEPAFQAILQRMGLGG